MVEFLNKIPVYLCNPHLFPGPLHSTPLGRLASSTFRPLAREFGAIQRGPVKFDSSLACLPDLFMSDPGMGMDIRSTRHQPEALALQRERVTIALLVVIVRASERSTRQICSCIAPSLPHHHPPSIGGTALSAAPWSPLRSR